MSEENPHYEAPRSRTRVAQQEEQEKTHQFAEVLPTIAAVSAVLASGTNSSTNNKNNMSSQQQRENAHSALPTSSSCNSHVDQNASTTTGTGGEHERLSRSSDASSERSSGDDDVESENKDSSSGDNNNSSGGGDGDDSEDRIRGNGRDGEASQMTVSNGSSHPTSSYASKSGRVSYAEGGESALPSNTAHPSMSRGNAVNSADDGKRKVAAASVAGPSSASAAPSTISAVGPRQSKPKMQQQQQQQQRKSQPFDESTSERSLTSPTTAMALKAQHAKERSNDHLRGSVRLALSDPDMKELVEVICENNGWSMETVQTEPHTIQSMELFLLQIPTVPLFHLFPYLVVVKLMHIGLRDMQCLAPLHHVEELWVTDNDVTNVTGISSMRRLKKLVLQNNAIDTMSGLPWLPQLEELWLMRNRLRRLEGLEKLPKLRVLSVAENQIETLRNAFGNSVVSNADKDGVSGSGFGAPLTIRKVSGATAATTAAAAAAAATNAHQQRSSVGSNGASAAAAAAAAGGKEGVCVNLKELNLSSNNLFSFSELRNLSGLPSLEDVWLSDPLFGDNPLCSLNNYHTFTLHYLRTIHSLDNAAISVEQHQLAESIYSKKRLYYSMRLQMVESSLAEMIRYVRRRATEKCASAAAVKRKLESLAVDLTQDVMEAQTYKRLSRPLASRCLGESPLKSVSPVAAALDPENELAVPAADALMQQERTKLIEETTDKLNKLRRAIGTREMEILAIEERCFETCEHMRRQATDYSERQCMELNTGGNVRLEEGLPTDEWFKSAKELLECRFDARRFEKFGIRGVQVCRVSRVHSKGLRARFDSRIAQLGVDLSDPSNRRGLVCLFTGVPSVEWRAPHETFPEGTSSPTGTRDGARPSVSASGPSTFRQGDPSSWPHEEPFLCNRIIAKGFDQLYYPREERYGVPLTNSLFAVEHARLLQCDRDEHLRGSRANPNALMGRVIVSRVFLGKCVAEKGGVSDINIDHTPLLSVPSRTVLRSQYPADVLSVHRTLPTEPAMRAWFGFDRALMLPEFVVDYFLVPIANPSYMPSLVEWADASDAQLSDCVRRWLSGFARNFTHQTADVATQRVESAGADPDTTGNNVSFRPANTPRSPENALAQSELTDVRSFGLPALSFLKWCDKTPFDTFADAESREVIEAVTGSTLSTTELLRIDAGNSSHVEVSHGTGLSRSASNVSSSVGSARRAPPPIRPPSREAGRFSARSPDVASATLAKVGHIGLDVALRRYAESVVNMSGSVLEGSSRLATPRKTVKDEEESGKLSACKPDNSEDSLWVSDPLLYINLTRKGLQSILVRTRFASQLLANVVHLVVRNNSISEVDWASLASAAPHLEALDLSMNKLLSLNGLEKAEFKELRNLDISTNALTVIAQLRFISIACPALEEVQCDNNPWDANAALAASQTAKKTQSSNGSSSSPLMNSNIGSFQSLSNVYACTEKRVNVQYMALIGDSLQRLNGGPVRSNAECAYALNRPRKLSLDLLTSIISSVSSVWDPASEELQILDTRDQRKDFHLAMNILASRSDTQDGINRTSAAAAAAAMAVSTPIEQAAQFIYDNGPLYSLDFVSMLPRLVTLSLRSHFISDLSPLARLKALRWLDVSDNNLQDISPLASLRKLQHLRIGENNIDDLSSLSQLTQLSTLAIDHNHVDVITPLQQCTALTELYLAYNNIQNIKHMLHLKELPVLAALDLTGNPCCVTAADDTTRVSSKSGAGGAASSEGTGNAPPASPQEDASKTSASNASPRTVNAAAGASKMRRRVGKDAPGAPIGNTLTPMPGVSGSGYGANSSPVSREAPPPPPQPTPLDTYRDYLIYHLKRLRVLDGVTVDSVQAQRAKDRHAGRINNELLAERLPGTPESAWNAVRELNLSYSNLQEMAMMESFRSVVLMRLDHNFLYNIDGLAPLANLVALNLSHNKLGHCHSLDSIGTTLSRLKKLESLSLEANGIPSCRAMALYMPRLRFLNLKFNELTSIDGLDNLPDLRELLLDNNNIFQIDGSAFNCTPQLLDLSIDENCVRTTDQMHLLTQLETLSIRSNRLADVRLVAKGMHGCVATKVTLTGNSVCRRQGYRPTLVGVLPNVTLLDGKPVSEEERSRADAIYANGPPVPPNVFMDFQTAGSGAGGAPGMLYPVQTRSIPIQTMTFEGEGARAATMPVRQSFPSRVLHNNQPSSNASVFGLAGAGVNGSAVTSVSSVLPATTTTAAASRTRMLRSMFSTPSGAPSTAPGPLTGAFRGVNREK